jgi:hypothetical protein
MSILLFAVIIVNLTTDIGIELYHTPLPPFQNGCV